MRNRLAQWRRQGGVWGVKTPPIGLGEKKFLHPARWSFNNIRNFSVENTNYRYLSIYIWKTNMFHIFDRNMKGCKYKYKYWGLKYLYKYLSIKYEYKY